MMSVAVAVPLGVLFTGLLVWSGSTGPLPPATPSLSNSGCRSEAAAEDDPDNSDKRDEESSSPTNDTGAGGCGAVTTKGKTVF